MSLARYRQKRRFDDTPEPTGGARDADARPIFVVQLHHASHRHYDFRLQVGGVLKSWAVPKGPSFDPKVNRLAMEVEDHPLDYAGFEGSIPEGNYGAGDVRIFDHGTWATPDDVRAQLGKGHLRFSLHGDKLRGDWDLIRTSSRTEKKPRWLLKKHDDPEAGPFEADDLLGDPATHVPSKRVWQSNRTARAKTTRKSTTPARKNKKPKKKAGTKTGKAGLEVPGARDEQIDAAFFEPALARRQDAPPTGAGWIHEPKWDGYRLLACVADGKVRLWSRNGIEWTERVPQIARAVASLGARALRLDGELIAVPKGRKRHQADFNALQAALSGDGEAELRYVVFDLLHVEGTGLEDTPLAERKRVLDALLEQPHDPLLVAGEVLHGDARALLAKALRAGYEGLVSKRADSPYRAGRGGDWVKARATDSEELAIIGYTEPKGSRVGIGALVTGRPLGGGRWAYAGRVGTGMGAQLLRELATQLAPLARETPPVEEESLEVPRAAGDLRHVHWVEPRLTIEVVHHGRGNGGLLRQPSVKAVRHDKRARELTPGGDRATGVRLSSGERVVYPEAGFTKADVFAYYQAVAPFILPEIVRRPLAIVRCTSGIQGACFFQKHLKPGWGPRVLGADVGDDGGEHLYVEDEEGLLSLAQMGVIEIHPWGCHVDDPDAADRIVFDLDPAPDVAWPRVKAAARRVRARLREDGLESYLRLSGNKGLHVVVPLRPAASWERVKGYAHAIATELATESPGDFVDNMSKKARTGRIFVDYLRNGRGATSIASYSLRRTPTATVAMPIAWSELARLDDPKRYDLTTTLRALARRRRDPWTGIDARKQRLPGHHVRR